MKNGAKLGVNASKKGVNDLAVACAVPNLWTFNGGRERLAVAP